MSKTSAPSPPDPRETANAQAEANRRAIRESAEINQIDINSPWGRQYYTGTIGQPDRALNIELTPGGERSRLAQEQLTELLSGFGLETLGPQVMDRLGQGDSRRVEDAIYQRGLERLQPEYEEGREALRSRLIGQGLSPGSRAYEQAMGQFGRREADALENLALSSISQGAAENRAQRSQSINELAALLQGAPAIGSPATQMPTQYQMAPPDIAGLTMGNYAGQLNAYNTRANELGGLYGLGGQLGGAAISALPWGSWLSDRRLKADIEPCFTWNGLRWYTYRYVWETGRRLGVMAQEALKICPEAVRRVGPWLAVDYGRLLTDAVIGRRAGLSPDGGGVLPGGVLAGSHGLLLEDALPHGFGLLDKADLLALGDIAPLPVFGGHAAGNG